SDVYKRQIYYSVIGDERQKKNSALGLKQATKFIQWELGRRIRIRYTPIIDFQFDTSLEYGNRIEKILRNLSYSGE
ncbi:MAG: 30S ribosome-binding factor RbfA, partial [Desulfobacterota bacterium]|nr:30S ribosome-binding factor RbfA [Thermodesulfobacteriota bacterium]